MLHYDLRYDNVRTWLRALDEVSFDEIAEIFDTLTDLGTAALSASRVASTDGEIKFAADMRYVGQEHPVTVELSSDVLERRDRALIKARFDEVHEQRYGTCAPLESAEIVSLRTSVIGKMNRPPIQQIGSGSAAPPPEAFRGARSVYFGGEGRVSTATYDRSSLLAGNRIEGPALIEEHASTTVVLPGDTLEVDRFGNLLLHIRAHA
jgi:N-methylhydantoinase A